MVLSARCRLTLCHGPVPLQNTLDGFNYCIVLLRNFVTSPMDRLTHTVPHHQKPFLLLSSIELTSISLAAPTAEPVNFSLLGFFTTRRSLGRVTSSVIHPRSWLLRLLFPPPPLNFPRSHSHAPFLSPWSALRRKNPLGSTFPPARFP